MSWSETLRAALRNVVRRPLRNALAMLGVVLATATLVALIALSAGVEAQLTERLADRPFLTTIQVTSAPPRAGEAPRALDASTIDTLAGLRGVRAVSPVIVFTGTLRAGDRAPGGSFLAVTPQATPAYALERGRAPRTDERDALVLTSAAVRALGLDLDSATSRTVSLELRRGETGTDRRTVALRVVGIAGSDVPGLGVVPLAVGEDALSWIATGESDAARDLRLAQQLSAALLFGARVAPGVASGSRYTAAWVEAESVARVRELGREIDGLGLVAASNTAAAETVAEVFGLIRSALVAIAAVAFAVAATGVLNALLTSVTERTVEIGVLKALGATDAVVQRIVVTEAAALGALGGLLGIGLGWIVALAASAAGRAWAGAMIDPRLDLRLALAALAAAVALAALAAWLPARRAAHLAPAEALRAE